MKLGTGAPYDSSWTTASGSRSRGRGTRSGWTLVELGVAAAILSLVLAIVFEASHFFSTRTAGTIAESQRARELGLVSERLRRILKLAHASRIVRRPPHTLEIFALVWRDGRWVVDPWVLESVGGGALELRGPEGQRLRYQVGLDGLGAVGRDGVVVVQIGEGDDAVELKVRPVVPTSERLVYGEGDALDVGGWEQDLNRTTWTEAPPAPPGSAGSLASGQGQLLEGEDGEIPGASGPTRNDLETEAAVLAVELSELGRRTLPVAPGEPGDRLDAWEVTQRLMADGYSAEEASFLAVLLAAAEFSDRYVRAAALAMFAAHRRAAGDDEPWLLIEELHPPLASRGPGVSSAEDLGDPGASDEAGEPTAYPEALLHGRRGRDQAQLGDALPAGYGRAALEPAEPGRAPNWDDWFGVLEGLPLDDATLAALPQDLRERLEQDGGLQVPAGLPGSPGDELPMDPAVGIPPDVYPVPEAGQPSEPLPRVPEVATRGEEFDEATEVRDARQGELNTATVKMNQAQAQVNSFQSKLKKEKERLERLQASLAAAHARQDDGHCDCPGHNANIKDASEKIEKFGKSLKSARAALQARRNERNAAQARRDAAQTDLDAAAAAFEASAEALEQGR